MKKIIALALLIVIVCTSFKEHTCNSTILIKKKLISDYRDAYTGTYFCKSATRSLSPDSHGMDLIADTISIVITKDAADSILIINLKTQTIRMKLLGNKILLPYPATEHNKGYFFASDSIDLTYLPARPASFRYRGKRQ